MKLQKVKIAELRPHPENYNTHPEEQIQELIKSLDMFDQFKNIVVCQGCIIAGHGLVEAAKRKGMTEIYALVRDDLTTNQQKALLLADNATPFLALPDTDKLNALLESFPSLDDIPGITDDWLAQFQVEDDSIDNASFDENETKNPVIKIDVSELEYDSLRRDITEILKGYESPKFV